MKKELFDDKIREKLQGHSLQPSAAAYAKLQSRMAAQGGGEKKGFYLWYGAAAASLALLLGFFAFQNRTTSENSLAAVKTEGTSQTPKKGQTDLAIKDANTAKTQETAKIDTENPVLNEKKADSGLLPGVVKKEVRSPKNENKGTASESKTVVVKEIPAETENLAKDENIFVLQDDKTDLALNDTKKEDAVLEPQDLSVEIVIGNGQAEQQGPAKEKKYKQIFKQLKNIKQGEGIDKSVLGEKTQWLLAVATSWRED